MDVDDAACVVVVVAVAYTAFLWARVLHIHHGVSIPSFDTIVTSGEDWKKVSSLSLYTVVDALKRNGMNQPGALFVALIAQYACMHS